MLLCVGKHLLVLRPLFLTEWDGIIKNPVEFPTVSCSHGFHLEELLFSYLRPVSFRNVHINGETHDCPF